MTSSARMITICAERMVRSIVLARGALQYLPNWNGVKMPTPYKCLIQSFFYVIQALSLSASAKRRVRNSCDPEDLSLQGTASALPIISTRPAGSARKILADK